MTDTLFADTGTAVADIPLDELALPADNVGPVDQNAVDQITASIREVGILQPLTVTAAPGDDHYTIVIGRHRYLAAEAAGLATVPCIIRSFDDATQQRLSMLVENLHRRTIDPVTEGRAYLDLVDAGLTQSQLADKVGRSQSHISKRIAVARLPEPAIDALIDGRITVSMAEDLTKVRDHDLISSTVGKTRIQPWDIRNAVMKQERADREAAFRAECETEGLIELDGHDWYRDYRSAQDDEQATHFFMGNMVKLVARDAEPPAEDDDQGDEVDPERAASEAQWQAEREERERRFAAWSAISDAHRRHITDHLGGKGAKFDTKLAAEHTNRMLVALIADTYVETAPDEACDLLGLTYDHDVGGLDLAGGAELVAFAGKTATSHVKAALAVVLVEGHRSTTALRNLAAGSGPLHPTVQLHYTWLRATGYEVGADEQNLLDRIITPLDLGAE